MGQKVRLHGETLALSYHSQCIKSVTIIVVLLRRGFGYMLMISIKITLGEHVAIGTPISQFI